MTKKEFVTSTQTFIRKHKMNEAFSSIHQYLEQEEKCDSELFDDLLVLEAQWKREKRKENLGTSESSTASNQILSSIVEIVRSIENDEFKSIVVPSNSNIIRKLEKVFPYLFSILILGFGFYGISPHLDRLDKLEEKKNPKYFLMSANKMWEKSNIQIRPGEKIIIKATGRANLSVVHNFEHAQQDKEPLFKWVGPNGLEKLPPKALYQNRKNMLIVPEQNYGALLMFACLDGTSAPHYRNPTPSSKKHKGLVIEKVGDELNYSLPSDVKNTATLYFTLNDTYISDNDEHKKSFVGTQKDLNDVYGEKLDENLDPLLDYYNNPLPKFSVAEMEERWEKIKETGFAELWFEDNMGAFLIEVIFKN